MNEWINRVLQVEKRREDLITELWLGLKYNAVVGCLQLACKYWLVHVFTRLSIFLHTMNKIKQCLLTGSFNC